MASILSAEQESVLSQIILNATERAAREAAQGLKRVQEQEAAVRLHRRKHLIKRRLGKRHDDRRVAKALIGLRALITLGQNPNIQSFIGFESSHEFGTGASEFCLYDQFSAREDAADHVGVYLRTDGISVHSGCDAAFDFSEDAFFPYSGSEEEHREKLYDLVHDSTDEPYNTLAHPENISYEWHEPHRIAFQVLVDCGTPERFAAYLDHAFNRYAQLRLAA